jgi:hypothetical protein
MHSVELRKFTPEQLNGQRLAFLLGRHIVCPAEKLHVREPIGEHGKHVVSITFVSLSDFGEAKRVDGFGKIHINEVSLDQATVDKIEVADNSTEYGKYSKMSGCSFVVLAEILSQTHQ